MLQDSPVGLAAYILDRFMVFTDPENKLQTEGGLDKYYDLNKLTDNIMLYWVTGSITTSMRLYKESFKSAEIDHNLARYVVKPIKILVYIVFMRVSLKLPVGFGKFILLSIVYLLRISIGYITSHYDS